MPKRSNGDIHFQVWMKEVDAALLLVCGMVAADLPDCTYRDWHDDGVSAKSAARRAYREAQFA